MAVMVMDQGREPIGSGFKTVKHVDAALANLDAAGLARVAAVIDAEISRRLAMMEGRSGV